MDFISIAKFIPFVSWSEEILTLKCFTWAKQRRKPIKIGFRYTDNCQNNCIVMLRIKKKDLIQ